LANATNALYNATNTLNASVMILNTNTFPVQSGLNISNRVVVSETNTAPLQSYLSSSNVLAIVWTNYTPLPSYNSTSSDVSVIKTNYFPLQSGLNVSNRMAALEVPYQTYTATISPDAGGTCTITYAHGSLVRIAVDTNITLTFDNTDYPTNGINRVGVEILALTNSVAFATSTITNATAPSGFTNGWVSLFFRKANTNTLWKGRQ
jgi:hypothetical protein